MWVRFDLFGSIEKQREAHKLVRQKLKEWRESGLVQKEVLTYQPDRLYVCLDIPSIKKPNQTISSEEISKEIIPLEITNNLEKICKQLDVRLGNPLDYEVSIRRNIEYHKKHGTLDQYYNGAPAEEILRFSSSGVKIALQILNQRDMGKLQHYEELARFGLSLLKKELGDNYHWLRWGFHFVCNPVGIDILLERDLWYLVIQC